MITWFVLDYQFWWLVVPSLQHFVKEPFATLCLVQNILELVASGRIPVLIAYHYCIAYHFSYVAIVFHQDPNHLSGRYHGIVWSWPMWLILRMVVPPTLRTRSAIMSIESNIASATFPVICHKNLIRLLSEWADIRWSITPGDQVSLKCFKDAMMY